MFKELVEYLGFERELGWIPADKFEHIVGPRGALRRARDYMGVCGAFGTWEYGIHEGKTRRFVPLLYVAQASGLDEARDKVHRRIWSQGLVPLLAICTPEVIILNEGFAYSNEAWTRQVKLVSGEELSASIIGGQSIDILDRFKPSRLLSSVSWRDFAINSTSRVDRRLLSTLSALSDALVKSTRAPRRAANALIGRFLYFYILRDRGFLSDSWLARFGAPDAFETRTEQLDVELVWNVFDQLDNLLNGTIFPLSSIDRSLFETKHVRLLRDCIKLGDSLHSEGRQLSFLDFEISALQTETLSAIYEQFLEAEDSAAKRKDGVFYTPPFLADFVLDRIEDEVPLQAGRSIIDCTAGSGVFIVGAYRRIIENSLLDKNVPTLPANQLRSLLLSSIFGIEKNPSAHAVAAFSLYLTMLDYVDVSDIERCLDGRDDIPLFPPLADRNLICADAFAIESNDTVTRKFDVVVGNPPWQKLAEITERSPTVRAQLSGMVDSDEAAEYALWWAAKHLAEPGGLIALIIPTKSLVGPSAKRFPLALSQNLEIAGVVNFSHFRYELFSNARQAACALFVRNRPPKLNNFVWAYSPTRAHMPGPVAVPPWALVLDRAQVSHVRQVDFAQRTDTWFETLMLREIDRHIRKYLSDQMALGSMTSMTRLFDQTGLGINRGGSPSQTNLPEALHFGADKFKANDIRLAPGVVPVAKVDQLTLFVAADSSDDVPSWLGGISPEFRSRFAGNVLLIPRSMQGLAYASRPIAFNSSINAIFFKSVAESEQAVKNRAELLQALGTYLQSGLAQYLFAITGKLWMLDRTRLERTDLLALPVPFHGINDPFVQQYLAATESQRANLVYQQLNLSEWLIDAINEYTNFRQDFEDGGVPTTVAIAPTNEDVDRYCAVLADVLRPVCEGLKCPDVSALYNGDPYTIAIRFSPGPAAPLVAGTNPLSSSGIAEFSDSIEMFSTSNQAITIMRKPAEKFRWTIESAFMDGIQIMQRLMIVTHE